MWGLSRVIIRVVSLAACLVLAAGSFEPAAGVGLSERSPAARGAEPVGASFSRVQPDEEVAERDLGEIKPGTPVRVDFTAADELVVLSFRGTTNQRWQIEVRDDTVAGCGPEIVVASPSDAPVTTSACLEASDGDAVVVPVAVTSTGTHKIRLAPGGVVGSVTVTLTEATLESASVAAGPIVIGGPPVTISLAPNASTVVTYDWAGTNRVVLEETNCTDMTYYFSYGAGYQGRACHGGPYSFTWRTVTPRTPGTHYIELYAGARPATVTLQMHSRAPDVTGTLTPGGPPISVTLGEPAQAAWISFAGTQGQNLVVEASTSASLPECWAGLDTRKARGMGACGASEGAGAATPGEHYHTASMVKIDCSHIAPTTAERPVGDDHQQAV